MRLEVIEYFSFDSFLFLFFCLHQDYEIEFDLFFDSYSNELLNEKKSASKLPRHRTSIKSNRKKNMKQIRQEFIRNWTENARDIYSQNHRLPMDSPKSSSSSSSASLASKSSSTNNNASLYLKSEKAAEQLECKIS